MEYHKKQRQALIEQLESGNVQLNLLQRSLDEAREEITEYRKGQVVQSERMDVVTEAQSKINVRVEENAANIRKTVDHLMGGSSDQIPMVP
jgi:predicted  nucleic acid-binding Zn-ribbon protein